MIKVKLLPTGKRGAHQYRIVVTNENSKLTVKLVALSPSNAASASISMWSTIVTTQLLLTLVKKLLLQKKPKASPNSPPPNVAQDSTNQNSVCKLSFPIQSGIYTNKTVI